MIVTLTLTTIFFYILGFVFFLEFIAEWNLITQKI